MKPVDEVIRIAAAGGGFRMDASKKQVTDLITIAAAASRHGAHIMFVGLHMRPIEELIQIAAAGKGSVIFED